MLPRTDLTGPRPLAAVEPARAITPLGDVRQESIDRLVRLEVGKQFQAQILSRFSDGTFLVRIADTAARLALPSGGKVGDGLALTLLATEPRPTFSLDAQSAGVLAESAGATRAELAPGARIAQALYLSNAAGQAAAAGTDGGAAPAALSNTGRLIDALLNAARQDGAATALVGKTPLSAAAGAAAPQLASALHDSLSFSGLFYESHVQQWANGERTLADLLREPQARSAKGDPAALRGSDADPALLAKMPPAVLEARRNLQEYFSAAPLPPASTAGGLGAIDPAAAQMINLQLNTLEHQRVLWQGELWPGQRMEWDVSRQDQSGSAGGQAGEAVAEHWQSVVTFSLPSLGVVSATINLSGDRVQIQVRTASDDVTTALQRQGPKLASALDAAGSTLDGLTIHRES
ncbi:MAG: flagellar hook-length control protein FliK [Herminiimonas sp.]|nr:flagellar hook-length control protein FliK [Herminiimonas sp.]